MGFQNGDKIISIDGNKVDRFLSISTDMVLRDESFNVEVERTGEVINIAIGGNFIKHWKNSGKKLLFSPRTSVEVESVIKDSESEKSGLLSGDVLVEVNGVETMFFDDFKHQLVVNKNNTVNLGVIRGLDLKTIPVMVSENGTIGFQIANNLNVSKEEFTLLASFATGYNLAMKKGALGGKLLGAGGGGYFLFHVSPFEKHRLCSHLAAEGLVVKNFKFEANGVQSWAVRDKNSNRSMWDKI